MKQDLLQRAIELAELGWGGVQPNPLVGAVVADADGTILGEGFHARHGGPHAEVVALTAAGKDARGATLYVSLEPCCHHGRTPPCTDAIIGSGISRVVFGAADPNPAAAGGAALLREHGIETSGPNEPDRVRRQNAIFFHAYEQQRVFVALKLACSLDGRIARTRGRPTDITNTQARAEMHRLRAGFDAIMVGSGTATADDPLLTARGSVTPIRPPIRIVLDTDAALSLASQLVSTISSAPVWLFCAPDAVAERTSGLVARGVRILAAPRARAGLDLSAVLDILWQNGVRSVFCEGGARLAGSLARLQRIDRFYLFLAPLLLGPDAVNAFDALPAAALPLELAGVQRFGPDVLLTYDRAAVHDPLHAIATDLEGYVHRPG